jgi:hypothetical protein
MRDALLREQCLLLVDITVDLIKLHFLLLPMLLYFAIVQKPARVLNNPFTDLCFINHSSSICSLNLSALLFLLVQLLPLL